MTLADCCLLMARRHAHVRSPARVPDWSQPHGASTSAQWALRMVRGAQTHVTGPTRAEVGNVRSSVACLHHCDYHCGGCAAVCCKQGVATQAAVIFASGTGMPWQGRQERLCRHAGSGREAASEKAEGAVDVSARCASEWQTSCGRRG